MSRQLISRANNLFNGRVTFSPYQQDKPGFAVSLPFLWRPTSAALTIAWTAGLAAGATSGTLSASWAGPAGLYPITFSDGEVLTGKFTASSTAVTFWPATPPAVGGGYGGAIQGSTANTLPGALVNAVTTAATVAGVPPAVGAGTTVAASQSVAAAANAVINGSLATGGVAIMDVPRNIVAAWTGTAIVTVTGTDYYGLPQTQVSASGTTLTGTKAFATVTSITSSAAITAFTAGTGNVLGLPCRVSSGCLGAPMFNDAADAGTFVVPDLTMPATGTTGDVRGTYTPGGTLNGAKFLSIYLLPADNTTQVGTYGVTPA